MVYLKNDLAPPVIYTVYLLDDLTFLAPVLDHSEVYALMSQAYVGMRRTSSALRSIQKALNLDAKQDYFLQRAAIFELLGRLSDAALDWESAAKMGTEG